ncbi:ABC transporter substrate-binding protein [soil metagenome]
MSLSLRTLGAAALLLAATLSPAHAQTPVKVGLALDLSGPFAAAGAEAKNGFDLAIGQLNGKLGGVPVEFIRTDMAGNPEQAKAAVDKMIQSDKIDLFTGPIGSNVALAVGPTLFAAKVPYISSNPGPSQYAGDKCSPYFFGQYQNDVFDEAAGKFASERKFASVVLIAPNYPAGKDHIGGFKRQFDGKIADEIYSKLGQLDYGAELAQIRAAKPAAVFLFLPGAMGINFIKQFVGTGMSKEITLITTAFSADEDIISAVGEPMLGLFNTSDWTPDLPNAANVAFVAAYRKAYNKYPSIYAEQAFEAIMHMDGAVKTAGGKVADREALLKAIKKADYASPRGTVKFGNNNFPIMDYYLRVIGKDASGTITNKTITTVLKQYQDVYASKCPLK